MEESIIGREVFFIVLIVLDCYFIKYSFLIKSLMCKHAPRPCFYEFLSAVSLRPLQIRVSKSQMWRAHPLGKLALNPLGRLPLVLDVLVFAQAVAPASRCDSDTSFLIFYIFCGIQDDVICMTW